VFVVLAALALGCETSDPEDPTPDAGGRVQGRDPERPGDAALGDAGSSVDAIAMTEIVVGDLTFVARVAGPRDGEVVFLLHGFPETSYEWRDVMPPLARAGFRVVAPDQRGYSPEARPEAVEDYATPLLARDVVDMADALDVKRFHVVGHDWGAAVAWVVATQYADRVLTLTAMSVPHPDVFAALLADPDSMQYAASFYIEMFTQPDFEDVMLANDAAFLRVIYGGIDEAAIAEYLRVLGTKEALGAALDWYRAGFDGRTSKNPPLGKTPTPTLMIWSDKDTALVREGIDRTAGHVTGPYRLEIIEGVDHWLVDREPGRVSELLLTHLGG
jgi:pimeloyl-ACP methyl ester carboxylesterase